MGQEKGGPPVALPTLRTVIGFLFVVEPLMPIEFCLRVEALSTLVTFVRFLSRVDVLVDVKM